jgi:transglutaminase-like putative cysteine protease
LDPEAIFITKKLLLAVLIVFSTGILCSSNLYATNETQIVNVTNLTPEQTSIEASNYTTSTVNTSQQAAGDSSSSQTEINNSTNSTETSQQAAGDSSSSQTEINNSTNSTETSQQAAGDSSGSHIRGVWLHAGDVAKLNITNLQNANITDVFVNVFGTTSPTYQNVLNSLINKLNGTGIRIHAWITCFKNANGWVDPQGKYSYQVQVPYKVWYKGWYSKPYTVRVRERHRIRFFSRGKWRVKWTTRWTHKTRYRRTYGWTYRWAHRQETHYGYDKTRTNQLINFISSVTKEYSGHIQGIHLDYVRYSGVGDNAAYKHGGTDVITGFVKDVYNSVKAINNSFKVSAALMPEGSANAKYYGQDYSRLSQYLDFLVPMIYKGNYGYTSSTGTNSKGQNGAEWITNTTRYIVEHSNGKPVVAGLQTYRSDWNVSAIPANELLKDIDAAWQGGSSGFVLFRYGLIDSAFFNSSVNPGNYPLIFTLNELEDAASRVSSFIETNRRLPAYVNISGTSITIPQLLEMLTTSILQINRGTTTPVSLKNIDNPTNSSVNNTVHGNIQLSEYIEMARGINSFINTENRAPNFAGSSLGNIGYNSLVYMFSRILNFHRENERLPNFVTVDSSIFINSESIPSKLQQYLQETKNCQVNDPKIKSLAASITNGKTSAYDKSVAIFNWVKDKISYSFYRNTQRGAVKTLNDRTGNCVDQTHLLIALSRAAGIPAKYMHGTCTFFTSGNTYGHVWAEVWVNDRWYSADTTSSRNTFGVINNWNTKTVVMKGEHASLPF